MVIPGSGAPDSERASRMSAASTSATRNSPNKTSKKLWRITSGKATGVPRLCPFEPAIWS